jgi:hypothetical protein
MPLGGEQVEGAGSELLADAKDGGEACDGDEDDGEYEGAVAGGDEEDGFLDEEDAELLLVERPLSAETIDTGRVDWCANANQFVCLSANFRCAGRCKHTRACRGSLHARGVMQG